RPILRDDDPHACLGILRDSRIRYGGRTVMDIRRPDDGDRRLIPRLNAIRPRPGATGEFHLFPRDARIGYGSGTVGASPTRRAGHGYRGFIPLFYPTRAPSWLMTDPVLMKRLSVQVPPVSPGRDQSQPDPCLPLKARKPVHRSP